MPVSFVFIKGFVSPVKVFEGRILLLEVYEYCLIFHL